MTTFACLVLGFWCLLALDWKRWWPGRSVLRPAPLPAGRAPASPSLLVVIPARNEAGVLGECLSSLVAQSGAFSRLVLVDDRSTDDTRAVASAVAAGAPEPGKISVVGGEELPRGWTGKLHALATGLRAAGRNFEWILFADADVRHPPGSIAALLEKATSERRDLVSIMVRLRAETFWEKLLIPPFVWFFQLLYPFRRAADPASRVAAAAGGCVLIKTRMLEKAGGLEAIRGAVIDDVGLAKRVKRAGGSLWLGLDPEMLSLRGYANLEGITRMVARTAFDQLGYRYSLVVLTFVFLGVFFASPPLLCAWGLAAGDSWTAALAGHAWFLESALFLPAVRHHRTAAAYCLTLPPAAVLYAYMTGVSAWRHLRGTGVEWKGRKVG